MSPLASVRVLDAVWIAAALFLWTRHGWATAAALAANGYAWLVLPIAPLAWLCADFVSGAIHWLGDRFFREDTPWIGPTLIRPFREHHRCPTAMIGHGSLELHGNSCLVVVVLLGLASLLPVGQAGLGRAAFDLWLALFLAAGAATNQLHLWAHHPSPPRSVRWLQRRGWILSPERHARHHDGAFDRSFCITCGWLNPLLDRTDLFGMLERAIRRVPPPPRAATGR